jgi:hypothetical protein
MTLFEELLELWVWCFERSHSGSTTWSSSTSPTIPPLFGFIPFTPAAENGYRLELVPSALVPQLGVWHRMKVVANDNAFDVFLGEPGRALHHCASWRDRLRTFRHGAVGVWEHGGEAGEYRALRVESLSRLAADGGRRDHEPPQLKP